MGGNFYDVDQRQTRSVSRGYTTKAREEIFASQMHESMNPRNVSLREARDSEQHPCTFPLITGLDVTGSMGDTPHLLIKNGLPHLVSQLVERGIPDIALCFIDIGDHITDRAPLQIGQFESGDEQLDTWLERSWLEGNGGGNGGESYLLAMVFAAFICQTDQWDKRQQRGAIITVGDEPPHLSIDKHHLIEIFGQQAAEWFAGATISAEELLVLVSPRWSVHHLHVNHGYSANPPHDKWIKLLGGERVHIAPSPEAVAGCLVDITLNVAHSEGLAVMTSNVPPVDTEDDTPDYLADEMDAEVSDPADTTSEAEVEVETI